MIITGAGTGEGPGGSPVGGRRGPSGDTRAWGCPHGKLGMDLPRAAPRRSRFTTVDNPESTIARSGRECLWGLYAVDEKRGIL